PTRALSASPARVDPEGEASRESARQVGRSSTEARPMRYSAGTCASRVREAAQRSRRQAEKGRVTRRGHPLRIVAGVWKSEINLGRWSCCCSSIAQGAAQLDALS